MPIWPSASLGCWIRCSEGPPSPSPRRSEGPGRTSGALPRAQSAVSPGLVTRPPACAVHRPTASGSARRPERPQRPPGSWRWSRSRDRIVTPFDLKAVGARASDPSTFALVPGARGGLFPVLRTEPGGVILGDDERHLDFRIWLDVAQGLLTVSTVVRFHGRRGRLYFRPIQPAHDPIFRATLKQTGRLLLDAASNERRAA